MGQFTSRQQKEVLTGVKERPVGREKSLEELLEEGCAPASEKALQLTTKAGINHRLVVLATHESVAYREQLMALRQLADINGATGTRDSDIRRMSDQDLYDHFLTFRPLLEADGIVIDATTKQRVGKKMGRPLKQRVEDPLRPPRTETTTGRALESLHPHNPSPPVPAQPSMQSTEALTPS